MKYVVKYGTEDDGYREAARLMVELRIARAELNIERRRMRCKAA